MSNERRAMNARSKHSGSVSPRIALKARAFPDILCIEHLYLIEAEDDPLLSYRHAARGCESNNLLWSEGYGDFGHVAPLSTWRRLILLGEAPVDFGLLKLHSYTASRPPPDR